MKKLKNTSQIKSKNLTADLCIINTNFIPKSKLNKPINPINSFINTLSNIKWKKFYNGFYEYSFKLSDNKNAKLIKMNPATKVPLHSYTGKEYILVLKGSFYDEYGTYSKGDIQINDSKIKNTPIACDNNGCICLIIVEKEIVFYGPFTPILNIITFVKSLIFSLYNLMT